MLVFKSLSPFLRSQIQAMVALRDSQYAEHKEITNALRLADPVSEVEVAVRLLVCNRRIAAFDDHVQLYRSTDDPRTFLQLIVEDNILLR